MTFAVKLGARLRGLIRVLIDTNILVSAILNRKSVPNTAFQKAMNQPYCALISEQNIEELRRVFDRKFPDKIAMLERFVAKALPLVEIIPIPRSCFADEDAVRDIDDRPILRAAIQAKVDIIVTGDKDFLESGLSTPKIMTAAEFAKQQS